jgi:iron complex transport system ATP-binding protein
VKSPGTGAEKRLELRDLAVGYRNKPVLRGINFSLSPGELAVLAGPNGVGKTTLLKTAGGFLKPLGGRVLVDQRDLGLMGKREKAGHIAFLFQNTAPLWAFTVGELVSQGRFHRRGVLGFSDAEDRAAVKEAIAASALGGFEDRPVTELSGGEYQRVLIARAMTQEAGLLLLDEPANNLDPKYQFIVMNLIRAMTEKGKTALLSLHDLNLASLYADRIILLTESGIAAQGTPAEALREDILREVFDAPLKVYPHPGRGAFPAVFPGI